MYIAEVCSKYRRLNVAHFMLFFPQDRFKLLREVRTVEFQHEGRHIWVGLDRSLEERARIKPLGQALAFFRDSLAQRRKDSDDTKLGDLKECDVEAKCLLASSR